MNPEREIYNIYVDKCKDYEKSPVPYEEFKKLWNKGKDIIIYMIKEKKSAEPYIAVEIDKNFVMYQEVRIGKIVTNIWTRDQYLFLLGRKSR